MQHSSLPKAPRELRWFVGVPLVSNPIILLDVALAALIVWLGAAIVIGLGQQVIGTGLTAASFLASIVLAGYLALGILAAFFVAGFVVLGNKYVALYRIDERGVYVEIMRGAVVRGGLLHVKPFPVAPVTSGKSAPRQIAWDEIHAIQLIPGMRAVILKGEKGGAITKLYCPDNTLYEAAVAALRAQV